MSTATYCGASCAQPADVDPRAAKHRRHRVQNCEDYFVAFAGNEQASVQSPSPERGPALSILLIIVIVIIVLVILGFFGRGRFR